MYHTTVAYILDVDDMESKKVREGLGDFHEARQYSLHLCFAKKLFIPSSPMSVGPKVSDNEQITGSVTMAQFA